MIQSAPHQAESTREPFELLDGCLSVNTQSEAEFLAGFEEQFWVLMHSEHDELVLDMASAKGLDLTAYQMVALNLFEVNPQKRLTLRIPDKLGKLFSQSKLYRKVEVEVVRFLRQDRDRAGEDGAPRDNEEAEKSERISQLISRMEALPADSQEVTLLAAKARETFGQLRATPADLGATSWQVSSPLPSQRERIFAEGGDGRGGDDALQRTGAGSLLDTRTGAVHELPAGGAPHSIGRIPDNDLQISSPLISRRHAAVSRRGDRYEVVDHGSGNGTFVNGIQLEPNQPKTLFHGDRVALAITRQFPQGAKVYVFQQAES